jgi:hypothetical protein
VNAVIPGRVRSRRFAHARYGFGFRRFGFSFFRGAGGRRPGAPGIALTPSVARSVIE